MMYLCTVLRSCCNLQQFGGLKRPCAKLMLRCQLSVVRTEWGKKLYADYKSVENGNKNSVSAVQQKREILLDNLNPVMEKKRQMVLMEIEVCRQSGELNLSSDELTKRDWEEILELSSPIKRKRYYIYIMKRKSLIVAAKKKRERKVAERIVREKEVAEETAGHIQYGLGRNTMYFRIGGPARNKMYNSKLAHAVLYGQKLVLDLDYSQHMRPKDIRSCVEQMRYSYSANAEDEDPFHLYFCNARSDDSLLALLKLSVLPLALPKPLIMVTEKSYLDIFPKNKLVYLTPDCQNDLTEYDHDAIYIIGCYVDMAPSLPLSLAKAKRDGLKMARLPLELYLHWNKGNKSLTVDQMMSIMLAVKNTNDWASAFKHVPRRKFVRKNSIERGPFRHRTESLFGPLVKKGSSD